MNSVLQGLVLLAWALCADGSDNGKAAISQQASTTNRPGAYYRDGKMHVVVTNAEQIATLADDVESYRECWILSFYASGATDAEFLKTPVLPGVRYVNIHSEKRISDEALAVLARFPALKDLSVGDTNISGSGFAHFAVDDEEEHQGACLERLLFDSSKVGEEALRGIAQIATLRHLEMSFPAKNINPQAFSKEMAKLPNLYHLAILLQGEERWTRSELKAVANAIPRKCQVAYGWTSRPRDGTQ